MTRMTRRGAGAGRRREARASRVERTANRSEQYAERRAPVAIVRRSPHISGAFRSDECAGGSVRGLTSGAAAISMAPRPPAHLVAAHNSPQPTSVGSHKMGTTVRPTSTRPEATAHKQIHLVYSAVGGPAAGLGGLGGRDAAWASRASFSTHRSWSQLARASSETGSSALSKRRMCIRTVPGNRPPSISNSDGRHGAPPGEEPRSASCAPTGCSALAGGDRGVYRIVTS
mmetsp:Transcript_20495/g.66421  ORF Transcript_20495/g.66421 Transcript_20495/m.66421 type:complete len:229 (-) Transcript_20495:680-1366(-)